MARSFLTDYLLATPYTYYASTADVVGITGDLIGDGLVLGMSGGDGMFVTTYRGIATPVSPAQQCFYYSDRVPTEAAGVYRDSNGARTVGLAFPFETINDAGDRQELLRRSLDFLGIRTAANLNGLKAYADGEWVVAPGKIVTAVFDGFLYIEDPDRTSGIKVISGEPVNVGDAVDVEGALGTMGNERHIQAGRVQNLGPVTALGPLGMTNRALGGSDLPSGGQLGVTGGEGLNNIGLLVTTCGRVTSTGADSFTISDGSGLDVKVVVPDTLSMPSLDAFVGVTGISSCEIDGPETVRIVRMRETFVAFP